MISKESLKSALLTSYDALTEAQQQRSGIVVDSGSVIRLGITLLIEGSRNGTAATLNNNGADVQKKDSIRIQFGKYAGKNLREIYQIDRAYLSWIAANCRNRSLQQASKEILQDNGLPTENISATVAAA